MVSPVPRKARKAQEKLANDFKTAKEAQARAEFCFLVPQKWVMNGIFSGDIPLHRPYIDLIYGRYLQFRFLKWPLIVYGLHCLWGWVKMGVFINGGYPIAGWFINMDQLNVVNQHRSTQNMDRSTIFQNNME